MGRRAIGEPVRHIISVRVSDDEYALLQELADGMGINISTLLRQSLNLIAEEAQASSRFSSTSKLPQRPFAILP